MATDDHGLGIPLPPDSTKLQDFPKIVRDGINAVAEILTGDLTPATEAAVAAAAQSAVATELDNSNLVQGDPIGNAEPVFAITDEDGGRSWLEIAPDGGPTQHAAELLAPAVAPAVGPALGIDELSTATGYAFAITDADGQFGAGLTLDGRWITNEDPAAQITVGTPVSDGTTVVTSELEAGTALLYAETIATGKRRALTTGPDHAKDPRLDGKGNVLYLAGNGTSWAPLFVPAAGGTPARITPNKVAAWGDSLTYSNNGLWENRLSTALGMPVANLGVSGERAEGIAARQGGIKRLLTVAGGTIPASGPVDVTADGVFVRPNQYQAAGTQAGTLAGVPGTLSAAVDASGVWQFTRTTAGAAVPVPAPSPWISDDSIEHRDSLNIIWAGRNAFPLDIDGPNGDAAGTAIAAMIANIASYSRRFVILTVLNGQGEGAGTAGHTAVAAFAAWLKATYPDNTLDMRRHLIDNGLALAGITPTAQDTADIAADTVPASLRVDFIHLTEAGYNIVADKLAEYITAKDWKN